MIFPFNFKKQFAAAVERGEKRQTIRRNRKDGKRPKVGDEVRCYTGLRTSATRWLRDGLVTRCRSIRLDLSNGDIVIDGEVMRLAGRSEFAIADGFPSWQAMHEWFCEQYAADGVLFEGFCVEWDPTVAVARKAA